MKRIKQAFLAATMATFLVCGSTSFTNAATKEDITSLIETTKKTEVLRVYPDGVRRKALQDRERIGDEEKNIYFGINYKPVGNGVEVVEEVLVIIDYIKHKGNKLDIKQLIIKDGYCNPDGKPDVIQEKRAFETVVYFPYVDGNGVEQVKEMASVDAEFPVIYGLDKFKGKERINKVFDDAVELFKLKTKGTLTDTEKAKYQSLKQEIETLALKSKHLQKSREELEQIYDSN